MKKNNNNIYKAHPTTAVVLFIVAIIFVFSLITIYYYQQFKIASLQQQINQNQSTKLTPAVSPTPDTTATWKTYRKGGPGTLKCQLKYPQGWTVGSRGSLSFCPYIPISPIESDKECFVIGPYNHQDVEDFINTLAEFKLGTNIKREKYINKNNIPEEKIVYTTPAGIRIATLMNTSQRGSIISFNENNPIHHQILSTFKFLD